MTPEEKIAALNKIYEMSFDGFPGDAAEKIRVCSCVTHNYRTSVCGSEKSVAFLRSCLFDADYLVRSRSFALAERRPQLNVNTAFLHTIFGDEEREWQLRALSALGKVGDKNSVFALKPLLFQAEKPLLIRGALWVFVSARVYVGEETLALLSEFLLSPYASYLKTSFTADAIATAVARAKGGTAFWKKICNQNTELKKAADFFCDYCANNPLLQVYPYPDYLTKQAQKQEITPREMKQALFFPRQAVKKAGKRAEKEAEASTN